MNNSRENAINFMESTIEVICNTLVTTVENRLDRHDMTPNDAVAALVVINSNIAARCICSIADSMGLKPSPKDVERIMQALPEMVRETFKDRKRDAFDVDLDELLKKRSDQNPSDN